MTYEIKIDGKKFRALGHEVDAALPGILIVILENKDIRYVDLYRHEVVVNGEELRAVQEEAKKKA